MSLVESFRDPCPLIQFRRRGGRGGGKKRRRRILLSRSCRRKTSGDGGRRAQKPRYPALLASSPLIFLTVTHLRTAHQKIEFLPVEVAKKRERERGQMLTIGARPCDHPQEDEFGDRICLRSSPRSPPSCPVSLATTSTPAPFLSAHIVPPLNLGRLNSTHLCSFRFNSFQLVSFRLSSRAAANSTASWISKDQHRCLHSITACRSSVGHTYTIHTHIVLLPGFPSVYGNPLAAANAAHRSRSPPARSHRSSSCDPFNTTANVHRAMQR